MSVRIQHVQSHLTVVVSRNINVRGIPLRDLSFPNPILRLSVCLY